MWSFTVSVIKIGIEIVVCLFLSCLLLAGPAMLLGRWRSRREEREMKEYRRKWQEEQREAGLASFKRQYGLDPGPRGGAPSPKAEPVFPESHSPAIADEAPLSNLDPGGKG